MIIDSFDVFNLIMALENLKLHTELTSDEQELFERLSREFDIKGL